MKTDRLNFKAPSFDDLSGKEWLVTNGIGGYASGTLSGANTRRYHGMLVAALNPPTHRTVMVSKVEESLLADGLEAVALSSNEYPGAIHPKGFEHLKSFTRNPIPSFAYEAAGRKIEKRVFMPNGSNATVIEYENTGKKTFDLVLRPFFVHRDYHSLVHESPFFNYHVSWITPQSGVLYAYAGATPLYFSFSSGFFQEDRHWYRQTIYRKETYRGLDDREDAYTLGLIRATLLPKDKIYLCFSQEETLISADPVQLKKEELWRIKKLEQNEAVQEISNKIGKFEGPEGLDVQAIVRDLLVAGDQFIVRRESSKGHTIIAGYHWFTDWGRDTMIAMRGLVIAPGKKDLAESIILTFLQYLDQGMLPNRFPDQGEQPEYNTIDATLWMFVVLHEYYEKFGDLDFIRGVFPRLTQIVESHIHGTRYNIHMSDEGLLFGGKGIMQLTWMDAKVGDHVVTPRHGCPVEINALWYNALVIYNLFAKRIKAGKNPYEKLAEKVKMSFLKFFSNGKYLYDVVIPGEYTDDAIRPNQVYALSLPFSLLDKKLGDSMMQVVKEKLVTPLGLRSLDPAHVDFVPVYAGDQWHRDHAYHQGTVWAFLLGEYWLAYLKQKKYTKGAKADILKMMGPILRHFYEADCIRGISEIFDGDKPATGRGCIHQAWSVGMLIRVLSELGRDPNG